VLDVLAQRPPAPPRILGAERLDDGPVRLGDLAQPRAVLDERDDGARLDAQRAPDLEQRLVPGPLDDDAVEADVVGHERMRVVARGGRTHRLVLGLEGIDATTEAHRGRPRRLLLERGAHRVDFRQLAHRHLAHAGAAMRLGDDESQRLELPQRLADRRLADPELVRELHLDDPLAGGVVALEDAREQHLLDLVAQHGSRQGHGVAFPVGRPADRRRAPGQYMP
jgi:hypothetical protein